jgi:hypothetical protein
VTPHPTKGPAPVTDSKYDPEDPVHDELIDRGLVRLSWQGPGNGRLYHPRFGR